MTRHRIAAIAACLALVWCVGVGGVGGVDRGALPDRPGGHLRPSVEGTVRGHVSGSVAPLPAIDDGCPVEVPDPRWERAIRVAAGARVPEAPREAACEFSAILEAESQWNPRACSPVGACGLPQLMPATAEHVGVRDRTDPIQAIRGGMRYYDWCVDMWGKAHGRTRVQKTRIGKMCWNAGPKRPLDIQGEHGCIQAPCMAPHLPRETYEFIWRTEHLQATGEWSPAPPDGWLGR